MSRVDDVERLMQVLSVLRAAETRAVPREELVRKVGGYARSSADPDSVNRMMTRDLTAMGHLGFRIENVAAEGAESAYVLQEGNWRLPVNLDPGERSLLVWATAAAGSATEGGPGGVADLIGALPRALDIAQTALASGRSLRLVHEGQEVAFRPALLAARHGRWFLLGCYGDSTTVKAPHLDRLEVLDLGEPMDEPVRVADPDVVLDPTAWPTHEERDAVVCCRQEDVGAVSSWFPRAQVDVSEGVAELRFWYRNEEALVSRVIGLAGSAWIREPACAAEALRSQVAAVLT